MAKAGPRTEVSRCSSCRRWAWPPLGAGKCKQKVCSLAPNDAAAVALSSLLTPLIITLFDASFGLYAAPFAHLTSTFLLPLFAF